MEQFGSGFHEITIADVDLHLNPGAVEARGDFDTNALVFRVLLDAPALDRGQVELQTVINRCGADLAHRLDQSA